MSGITEPSNTEARDPASASSLPAIYAVGTHYEVGYVVGAKFSKEIEEFYDKATGMTETLVPFFRTQHGRQIYDEYLHITREIYPEYVEEMQGIADGSGRPFHEVFLLHIAPEITTLLQKDNEATSLHGSCTTLLLNYMDSNGEQKTILVHNEDATPGMRKCLTYVVHARVFLARGDRDIPSPASEEWTAFCYPGHLGGNTFAMNTNGLAITTNRLFPVNVQRGKIPYYIAARALLTARSVDDAECLIAKSRDNVATGMSVSLAQASEVNSEHILANIEISPTDDNAPYGQVNYDFKRIPVARSKEDGFYYHFNKYIRIPGVDESDEQSSIHRRTRAEELPVPSGLDDVLSIVGDTKDEQFPIYRSGKAPDYLYTCATGVFNLVESTFSIYLDNPSLGTQGPVMTMPIGRPLTRDTTASDKRLSNE